MFYIFKSDNELNTSSRCLCGNSNLSLSSIILSKTEMECEDSINSAIIAEHLVKMHIQRENG